MDSILSVQNQNFFEGEEQEPMEAGEQRDGSVAEHAGHSKRDLERGKTALMKLHVKWFIQV